VDENADKPPVARLLSAGAKRAGRVAHATGVDRALDEAVEEAIVRALSSPAVGRAIDRAMAGHAEAAGLSSEEMARIVKQVLESEAAEQAWGEVLESRQLQMLIERIAEAPEIRSAIAAQGAGLITDIGVKLTRLTEAFDDALERMVRHREPDSETNQAGLATRLVAFGIDFGLLFAIYSLASGVIASVVSFSFGGRLTLAGAIVVGVIAYLLGGAVLVLFWSLGGQTPGMRVLSIRLMQDGSRDVTLGRAIKRLFALALALLPLGLGYFWILRDPSRHAWHDTMTGTEVIYDEQQRAPYVAADATTGAESAALSTSGPGPGDGLGYPYTD
jgi:uncharacterized RDD family membrane protein YckC